MVLVMVGLSLFVLVCLCLMKLEQVISFAVSNHRILEVDVEAALQASQF